MQKKESIFICVVLFSFYGTSQSNVVASGGNGSGSGGTSSYTIGQVDYTSASSAGGSYNLGVQQPYEIFAEILEQEISISLSVFPNPTTNELTLSLDNYLQEDLKWNLLDLNGKIVFEGQIKSTLTQIPTSTLEPAVYFLQVTHENQSIQKFKIIKN